MHFRKPALDIRKENQREVGIGVIEGGIADFKILAVMTSARAFATWASASRRRNRPTMPGEKSMASTSAPHCAACPVSMRTGAYIEHAARCLRPVTGQHFLGEEPRERLKCCLVSRRYRIPALGFLIGTNLNHDISRPGVGGNQVLTREGGCRLPSARSPFNL